MRSINAQNAKGAFPSKPRKEPRRHTGSNQRFDQAGREAQPHDRTHIQAGAGHGGCTACTTGSSVPSKPTDFRHNRALWSVKGQNAALGKTIRTKIPDETSARHACTSPGKRNGGSIRSTAPDSCGIRLIFAAVSFSALHSARLWRQDDSRYPTTPDCDRRTAPSTGERRQNSIRHPTAAATQRPTLHSVRFLSSQCTRNEDGAQDFDPAPRRPRSLFPAFRFIRRAFAREAG